MDIRLGRLRQWAGEVISSREKPSINEEFKALEKDIEIRKDGITKLILSSKIYHRTLSKKKKTTDIFLDDERLLPIDILGLVMMRHGEQLGGGDSTFGDALVMLGSAHCKIATLQEAYALTFNDTFVASMERFRDEIKVYEVLRKKLESRRSAADAASSKFEKLQSGKKEKEKEKAEAEDEMQRTKQRYEEVVEDLRANLHAIQENEYNQLHELKALIDIQFNFVHNHLQVLKDVRAEWKDCVLPKQPHLRNRSITLQSQELGKLALDNEDLTVPKRAESKHGRRSSNASIKPPSRPTSRLSRKRANSGAASIVESVEEKTGGKEKERSRRMSVAEWATSAMGTVTGGKGKKNKDREAFAALDDGEAGGSSIEGSKSLSTFMSIAKFASKSAPTISHVTEALAPIRPGKPRDKKIGKALFDFEGGSDELSFKAGTEIVILNEVLDEWWMGEVDGQTGLFPTSYVEVLDLSSAHSAPSAPSSASAMKPSSTSNSRRGSVNGRQTTPKHKPITLSSEKVRDDSHYLTSDAEDDDLRELAGFQPVANANSAVFGTFGNHSKTFSMDEIEDLPGSNIGEEDQGQAVFSSSSAQGEFGDDWVRFNNGGDVARQDRPPFGTQQESKQSSSQQFGTPKQRTLSLLGSLNSPFKNTIIDSAQQPLISRSKSDDPSLLTSLNNVNIENAEVIRCGPSKKVPPPPPPRRANQLLSVAPPIPLRKAQHISQATISSSSSNSSLIVPTSNQLNVPGSCADREVRSDQSPFDSVVELGLSTDSEVGEGTCDRFRQNPFKPKGMCSACLQFHVI